ncbi:MAG TPA: DsbA family protein [Geobacterales bacterium]|nr:DsbA family protein [Geobacterales bacterium]
MGKIKIEFFHDVLCAWCFVLSPRLHRIVEKFDVDVVHRSFALAPTPGSIAIIFGSKEKGKKEILNHWRMANKIDDEHRINADLMEKRDFDYPYSIPGLLACKAAELQGGNEVHWKMFDRIQKAHLVECLNIADYNVLKQCANDIGLDVERFEKDYRDPKTMEALQYDFRLARKYGITAVPTLVANSKHFLVGAQPYEFLEEWISSLNE